MVPAGLHLSLLAGDGLVPVWDFQIPTEVSLAWLKKTFAGASNCVNSLLPSSRGSQRQIGPPGFLLVNHD
jgi:hypothetical protein